MKKISKDELISMNAYSEFLNRFIEQTNNTDEPVLIESLFNGKNTVADLIWLSGRTCNIEKIRKFTRDIVLINIERVKPYCSEVEYDLILNFLKTGENAADAVDAVNTTVRADAADAVDAAADATYAYDVARVADYVTHDGEIDFTPYLQELFS